MQLLTVFSLSPRSIAATDLLLRLGEYDVSNDKEPFGYIERRVQIIASHPQFNPRTFEYDLALLRFYEKVPFRKNILPVCIPEGNSSYVNKWATVTGWGRLYEDGPLPDLIQHVKMPIITNKECEQMYNQAGYIEDIPYIFICAGLAKGGRDSCEVGDSDFDCGIFLSTELLCTSARSLLFYKNANFSSIKR